MVEPILQDSWYWQHWFYKALGCKCGTLLLCTMVQARYANSLFKYAQCLQCAIRLFDVQGWGGACASSTLLGWRHWTSECTHDCAVWRYNGNCIYFWGMAPLIHNPTWVCANIIQGADCGDADVILRPIRKMHVSCWAYKRGIFCRLSFFLILEYCFILLLFPLFPRAPMFCSHTLISFNGRLRLTPTMNCRKQIPGNRCAWSQTIDLCELVALLGRAHWILSSSMTRRRPMASGMGHHDRRVAVDLCPAYQLR